MFHDAFITNCVQRTVDKVAGYLERIEEKVVSGAVTKSEHKQLYNAAQHAIHTLDRFALEVNHFLHLYGTLLAKKPPPSSPSSRQPPSTKGKLYYLSTRRKKT